MAEKLLMEQNEFYPFGATIDSNEEQTSVGFYEGDEFPTSESIIQGLKSSFEKRIYLAKSGALCFCNNV